MMTEGISLAQFEKITRMGAKMDGQKVLVRAPKHGISSTGESREYYRIELPVYSGPLEHEDLWLIPVKGDGSIARSGLDRDDYRYSHGGSVFRAAIEVAKELASALGFPC